MERLLYLLAITCKMRILAVLLTFALLTGCAQNTFSNEQINNPRQISLPIDNKQEALQFSLTLEQVKSELNKPLEGRMSEYNKYDWWGDAFKSESQQYEGKDVWIVNWFKGPGECTSPHGCQILIASDGSVVFNFTCNDGWNCK